MSIEETIEKHRDIIKLRIKESRGRLRLHLGCGVHKMPGWINIDISESCKPDIVYDISQGIPFHKRSITNIFSRDFLEHIQKEKLIPLMNDCHRVLKVGGICTHEVPDVARIDLAFQDPTHVNFFSYGTAFYWAKKHKSNRWEKYGKAYGINPFRLVKVIHIPQKHTGQPSGWLRMSFYR